MEYQKLTITLPEYLYQRLMNEVPKGKRSQLIADCVEKKLTEEANPYDIFENIATLREEAVPYRKNISIDQAKKKGRHK